MKPVALTIAGSDPSGGAGIQADLKTFHQRGVYGMSVVTLLTVQNTQAVKDVWVLEPEKILAQLDAVLEDIPCQAAKTGALGNGEVIKALADYVGARRARLPARQAVPLLVIDPVMISKHGAPLLAKEAREAFKKELLPCATLVTPNLFEAEALTGVSIRDEATMEKAAKLIFKMGVPSVLIKGGHLEKEAADLLYHQGKTQIFKSPRIHTPHTHGTGCTFSAAITAELAKGMDLKSAVETAKVFIARAIETNPGLGHGCGPVNHHAEIV